MRLYNAVRAQNRFVIAVTCRVDAGKRLLVASLSPDHLRQVAGWDEVLFIDRCLQLLKPGGRLLELGTGTGLSTCWILDGMNPDAHLISVDNDENVIAVARKHLGTDTRVKFVCEDGAKFLTTIIGQRFDFIFADTWPGKFTQLDEALCLLAPSGIYVIDDLLPQPNWREGHAPKVPRLIEALEMRQELFVTKLNWATGLVVATRKAE